MTCRIEAVRKRLKSEKKESVNLLTVTVGINCHIWREAATTALPPPLVPRFRGESAASRIGGLWFSAETV